METKIKNHFRTEIILAKAVSERKNGNLRHFSTHNFYARRMTFYPRRTTFYPRRTTHDQNSNSVLYTCTYHNNIRRWTSLTTCNTLIHSPQNFTQPSNEEKFRKALTNYFIAQKPIHATKQLKCISFSSLKCRPTNNFG